MPHFYQIHYAYRSDPNKEVFTDWLTTANTAVEAKKDAVESVSGSNNYDGSLPYVIKAKRISIHEASRMEGNCIDKIRHDDMRNLL